VYSSTEEGGNARKDIKRPSVGKDEALKGNNLEGGRISIETFWGSLSLTRHSRGRSHNLQKKQKRAVARPELGKLTGDYNGLGEKLKRKRAKDDGVWPRRATIKRKIASQGPGQKKTSLICFSVAGKKEKSSQSVLTRKGNTRPGPEEPLKTTNRSNLYIGRGTQR